MKLVPALPPLLGETTVSWTGRLARKHANIGCAEFLRILELSQKHVMETTNFCVDRLAKLTGIHGDRIMFCGVQRVSERTLQHRGQCFGTSFALRNHTTYCPACLLADSSSGSESQGLRVGRVAWLFRTVQVCPEHRIELVRRANSSFAGQFQDMSVVAPSNLELDAEAGNAPIRDVSAMQEYTQNRFDGLVGAPWLDGQQIDQGMRACEMIGACLLFGAHCDFDRLGAGEMDDAGSVGFEAASKGVKGVREALDLIATSSFKAKSTGGPQAAYGRLYQWLQFNKSKQDRGPIQNVVREHILETMPIAPGTKLFGVLIKRQRRHSVHSLAKATGLQLRALNRALVRTGVLPDGDEGKTDSRISFPAEAGEILANRIRHSLPITKLPSYLNCNRTQAQMVVRQGFVSQIVPGIHKTGGVLTNVAIEDLDGFLKQFRSCGKPVSSPSSGMMDVISASEIARQTVADIVCMVLDERLGKLEVLEEGLRFRSVLVDPEEIRSVVAADLSKLGLTAHEAAERLGIFSSGLMHLRTKLDLDGEPFISASETKKLKRDDFLQVRCRCR